MWMYLSWIEDQDEKNNFARSYSILQGSFTNPEMARKMIQTPTVEMNDDQLDYVMAEIDKGKVVGAAPKRKFKVKKR